MGALALEVLGSKHSLQGEQLTFTQTQKDAISDCTHNILVVSGPGTGKTAMIAGKVAALLNKGYKSEEILVTTYTNKATEELRSRIHQHCKDIDEIEIVTIHAFCKKLIKRYWHYSPFKNKPRVIRNEIEVKIFVYKEYKKLGIDIPRDFDNEDTFHKNIGHLCSIFDSLHENNITDEDLEKYLANGQKHTFNTSSYKMQGLTDKAIATLFKRYKRFMYNKGVLDFSQSLSFCHRLLKEHTDIREDIQQQYRYIIVDEYQDTSLLQNEIFKHILGDRGLLFAVGDDDQNIYGFRGTSTHNILNFTKNFSKAKVLTVVENFRSTPSIVQFTKHIIEHNAQRFQKNLQSVRQSKTPTYLLAHSSKQKNAQAITELLVTMKRNGIIQSYSEAAILFHSVRKEFPAAYQQSFTKAQIPYLLYRSGDFFNTQVIKTILKIFECMHDVTPLNNTLMNNLMQVLQHLGISDQSRANIREHLKNNALLSKLQQACLESCGVSSLERAQIQRLQALAAQSYGPLDLSYHVFGMFRVFRALEWNDKSLDQLAYWTELAQYYEEWSSDTSGFVQQLHIFEKKHTLNQRPANEHEDGVHITTIHGAKGLQYRVVFVCDFDPEHTWQKDLEIPHALLSKQADTNSQLVEERYRLLYVGLTRAQEYLFLVHHQPLPPYIKKAQTHHHIQEYTTQELPPATTHQSTSEPTQYTYLSYSSMQMYEDCPLRYKLEQVHGFHTPQSDEVIFGQMIHDVLEQIHSKHLAKKEISPEEIEQILDSHCKRLCKDQREQALQEARDIIHYYQTECFPREHVIVDVEADFELFFERFCFRGTCDLITRTDEALHIHDFKTGQSSTDAYAQVLSYALAYQRHGATISTVRVYSLRERSVLVYTVKAEELTRVENRIKQAFHNIIEKLFDAKPHEKSCSRCPFRSFCPHSVFPQQGQEKG